MLQTVKIKWTFNTVEPFYTWVKTHSFKPTCSPPHTHLIKIYSRDLQSTPHILTKDVCPLGEFVLTKKCT